MGRLLAEKWRQEQTAKNHQVRQQRRTSLRQASPVPSGRSLQRRGRPRGVRSTLSCGATRASMHFLRDRRIFLIQPASVLAGLRTPRFSRGHFFQIPSTEENMNTLSCVELLNRWRRQVGRLRTPGRGTRCLPASVAAGLSCRRRGTTTLLSWSSCYWWSFTTNSLPECYSMPVLPWRRAEVLLRHPKVGRAGQCRGFTKDLTLCPQPSGICG